MAYLSESFVQFFNNLSENNNTAWFDANRKTYETVVKKPFEAFVQEMIARIAAHDPEVTIPAKDAIFRINKDIRFSKDKTPYNTHVAANISKYGRKDKAYPGFYFQLSHTGAQVFGGAYMPEKETLEKIRGLIAGDLDGFGKLIDGEAFKSQYGTLKGEAVKRIPEEWKAAYEKQPLVANKQFFYQAELPASAVTDERLPDRLMEYYTAAKDVNAFLRRAFI
jgi:uncharacterized protein (TIGR02453 family)